MQASAILSCQISSWYPAFGHLGFKSKIFDLPQDFVDFLVQDGVFVPDGSSALPRRADPDPYDDEYKEWTEEDEPQNAQQEMDIQIPYLDELRVAMEAAISELGGRVAPKFTWSSPHDATWVSATHSLSCGSLDEVLLLLKSSDRVMHDICHAFDACPALPREPVRHALALRKWIALKPERELRCFVRQRDLIAISQRNVLEAPDVLYSQEDELREMLLEFFEEHLQDQFPEADYTFDVYVTTAGKMRLLDFNPIGGATSALLFTWEELGYPNSSPSDGPEADQRQAVPAEARSAQPDRQPTADAHAAAPRPSHMDHGNARAAAPAHGMSGQAVPAAARSEDMAHAAGHAQNGGAGHEDGHSAVAGAEDAEILVRFVDPGISMLRPASALYGAPHDMADLGEGSAISEMMRKLQTQEQEDAQEREQT